MHSIMNTNRRNIFKSFLFTATEYVFCHHFSTGIQNILGWGWHKLHELIQLSWVSWEKASFQGDVTLLLCSPCGREENYICYATKVKKNVDSISVPNFGWSCCLLWLLTGIWACCDVNKLHVNYYVKMWGRVINWNGCYKHTLLNTGKRFLPPERHGSCFTELITVCEIRRLLNSLGS